MRSTMNHNIPSWQESSLSTTISSPDDYGECDVSLQSYNKSAPQEENNFRLSDARADASDSLLRRLRAFGPSSGDRLKVSKTGKCSFETAGGNIIDVSIRDDCKAITISSVVHKVKHGDILNKKRSQRQSSRGSYSLMTKMMKYNALLSRQQSAHGETAGSICAHDGTFLFYVSINISALAQPGKLEASVENAMLKSMEITKEFSATREPEQGTQHARRRRFLVGAYNRSTNY